MSVFSMRGEYGIANPSLAYYNVYRRNIIMKKTKRRLISTEGVKSVVAVIITMTIFMGCIVPVVGSYIRYNMVDKKCSRIEETIEQYTQLCDRICEIDNDIEDLRDQYNQNIMSIYEQVLYIQEESTDQEIRGKVIDSISPNITNPVKLEASILALMQNYNEFCNDPVISHLLDNNSDILFRIEEDNTLRTNLIEELSSPHDQIQQIAETEIPEP